MNSMYFNEKNRDLMMKFIKNLCDMSYDYKEYYNDIHIKPEDCGAFSVEWSQERWSEPDGEFKYETYTDKENEVDELMRLLGVVKPEDNVIKPNTNWETKTMLLKAEQEDELREGADPKNFETVSLKSSSWATPATTTEAKPNWYVDYNEPPYKHYVDYNEPPYKYNV